MYGEAKKYEPVTFIENMSLGQLQQAAIDTTNDIERQKRQPGFVQHDFSNALEARLTRIYRKIAEMESANVR